MFLRNDVGEEEGFFAKSRKKMKKVGRILAAMTIGFCTLTVRSPVQAGTFYEFDNPSSGNEITVNENGFTSNNAPSMTSTVSGVDGNTYICSSYRAGSSGASGNSITINGGNIEVIVAGSSTQGDTSNNNVQQRHDRARLAGKALGTLHLDGGHRCHRMSRPPKRIQPPCETAEGVLAQAKAPPEHQRLPAGQWERESQSCGK